MNKIPYLFASVIFGLSQVDARAGGCPDPPQQIARTVIQDIKGTAVKAGPITAGSAESRTEVVVKDLQEKVPNLDKVIICLTVQSVACQFAAAAASPLERAEIFGKMTSRCYDMFEPKPPAMQPVAAKALKLTTTSTHSKTKKTTTGSCGGPVLMTSGSYVGELPTGHCMLSANHQRVLTLDKNGDIVVCATHKKGASHCASPGIDKGCNGENCIWSSKSAAALKEVKSASYRLVVQQDGNLAVHGRFPTPTGHKVAALCATTKNKVDPKREPHDYYLWLQDDGYIGVYRGLSPVVGSEPEEIWSTRSGGFKCWEHIVEDLSRLGAEVAH